MWNLTEPQNLYYLLAPLLVLGVHLLRKRKAGLTTLLQLGTHREVLHKHFLPPAEIVPAGALITAS